MDASWKCQANKENWKSPVIGPFPLELTCYERYSKNRRKLQFSLLRSSWFFLLSIKIAQLVSDIKQHHMTNTYHTTIMAADGFLFNRSIHSSIHARLLANQFFYTTYTPLQINGEGGEVVYYVPQNSRWVFVCTYTAICVP